MEKLAGGSGLECRDQPCQRAQQPLHGRINFNLGQLKIAGLPGSQQPGDDPGGLLDPAEYYIALSHTQTGPVQTQDLATRTARNTASAKAWISESVLARGPATFSRDPGSGSSHW